MLIASIEIANGHILEEDGCILSDSLIRCDQRHIRIHRRCLFIVVSEASNAGVKVDLIVRGICCILPGVKGYTENLRVTSIVGRYLEHPRIFLFGTGADQKIYIGSADMMTRNTEKRVEVACPVYDETIRKQLTHMLKIMLADNVKARELKSDGKYYMKEKGTSKVNSQEYFMREAITVRHPEGRTKQSFVDKIRKIFRRK